MENTSKALLIAAGVLIVILIITFGIKIFSSSSDSIKTATETGKTISERTREATDIIELSTTGKISFSEENLKTQTDLAYQQYIKQNNPSISATEYIKNRLNSVYGVETVTNVSGPENDNFVIKININGENKEYKYNYKTSSISILENRIINFKIDGKTYQAKEGMNWIEWCNSEYNNDFVFYTRWNYKGSNLPANEDKSENDIFICKKMDNFYSKQDLGYCEFVKGNLTRIITNEEEPAFYIVRLQYSKGYVTSQITNNGKYNTIEKDFNGAFSIIWED